MGSLYDILDIGEDFMAKKAAVHKRHGSGLEAPRNSLELPMEKYHGFYAARDNILARIWERDVSFGEVHSYTHTTKNDQETWISEKERLRNGATKRKDIYLDWAHLRRRSGVHIDQHEPLMPPLLHRIPALIRLCRMESYLCR